MLVAVQYQRLVGLDDGFPYPHLIVLELRLAAGLHLLPGGQHARHHDHAQRPPDSHVPSFPEVGAAYQAMP